MPTTLKYLTGILLILAGIWYWNKSVPSSSLVDQNSASSTLSSEMGLMTYSPEIMGELEQCLEKDFGSDTIAIVTISPRDCFPCVNEVDEYTKLLKERNIPIIAGIRSIDKKESDRFLEVTQLKFNCIQDIPIREGLTNSVFIAVQPSRDIL